MYTLSILFTTYNSYTQNVYVFRSSSLKYHLGIIVVIIIIYYYSVPLRIFVFPLRRRQPLLLLDKKKKNARERITFVFIVDSAVYIIFQPSDSLFSYYSLSSFFAFLLLLLLLLLLLFDVNALLTFSTTYSSALPPPLASPVVRFSRKILAAFRCKSFLTVPPRWSPWLDTYPLCSERRSRFSPRPGI